MDKIILRIYKTPEEDIKKYNLICKTRYVYYDYINKTITDAGIPEGYTGNDFFKTNKHRFKIKAILPKYPLF